MKRLMLSCACIGSGALAVPPAPVGITSIYDLAEYAGGVFGLPPHLMTALVYQESKGNIRALSPRGAMGLTQLMPGTARELGVTDPWNPWQNVWGGARYLRQQLNTFGRYDLALAAYNAGAGNVRKHGGIPPFPETLDYVNKVSGYYTAYSGQVLFPGQRISLQAKTSTQPVVRPASYRSTLPTPASRQVTPAVRPAPAQKAPVAPQTQAAPAPAPAPTTPFSWATATLNSATPTSRMKLVTEPLQLQGNP